MRNPVWIGASAILLQACASGGSTGDPDGGRTGGAGSDDALGSGGAGGGTSGAGGAPADAAAGTGGAGGTGARTDGGAQPDSGADAAIPAGTLYVYVSGGRDQIAIFTLDLQAGTLAARPSATAAIRPGYMAFAPDKKHLYGVGGASASAFTVNSTDGSLTKVGGDFPAGTVHARVHPTGRWLLTADFGGSRASVLPINAASGALGAAVDTRTTAMEAHQVMVDPSGAFVLVPCRGGNTVVQYTMNVDTGALAPNNPATVPAEAAGAGPRHGAFHPSGNFVYVLNESNGTITSYQFNKTQGTLSGAAVVSAVPAGVNETASAHIEVHPTGGYVFVSNRRHNSIGVFAVNPGSGRLTVVTHETAGGMISNPRDFTVDPTGNFVLVANQTTGTLLVLRINQADGRLTRVGNPVTGLGSPSWVGAIMLP